MDTTSYDRPFAEVADRLILWQAVQDAATPGYFTRAWYRAGFHLFYVEGLPYPPRWAEKSTAAYRDGILKAFVRQWEAEGRADIITCFWKGLVLVLAEELAQHVPPPPV